MKNFFSNSFQSKKPKNTINTEIIEHNQGIKEKIEITKEKIEKIEKQGWILILSWSVIFVYFLIFLSKQINQKK